MKNIYLVLLALSFSVTAFADFDNPHTLTFASTPAAAPTANDQQMCDAFAVTKGQEFSARNPQIVDPFPYRLQFKGYVESAGNNQTYCRVTVYKGCDYYVYGYPAYYLNDCNESHASVMQRLRREHPLALDLDYPTVQDRDFLGHYHCAIRPLLIDEAQND
jgi:hypothetical protein